MRSAQLVHVQRTAYKNPYTEGLFFTQKRLHIEWYGTATHRFLSHATDSQLIVRADYVHETSNSTKWRKTTKIFMIPTGLYQMRSRMGRGKRELPKTKRKEEKKYWRKLPKTWNSSFVWHFYLRFDRNIFISLSFSDDREEKKRRRVFDIPAAGMCCLSVCFFGCRIKNTLKAKSTDSSERYERLRRHFAPVSMRCRGKSRIVDFRCV